MQIVRCVVDAKDVMFVQAVANKCKVVLLFIGKCVLVSIVRNVVIACQ